MRILMISTLFPPFVQGGAEICAHNLATWLAGEGHDVAVLTTAPTPADEVWDEMAEGCRIFRVSPTRPYSFFAAGGAPAWQKPLWHLQDLFDPRNEAMVEKILDAVKPDVVNIQYLQGIGYNALKTLGRRKVPVVFTLHDLGLACVNMAMFAKGRECERLCPKCSFSAKVKLNYLRRIDRLGFISPSAANMDRLTAFQPIGDYPFARVPNANAYPEPVSPRTAADRVRLLYVGRMHETKGVDVVLKALDDMGDTGAFSLELLGSGPQEAEWRAAFADRPWVHFSGQVSQQQVANQMAQSDLQLVPSICNENSPGVIIQALGLGLPVMASDKGGMPELVQHQVNGLLVEPGNVAAWKQALADVIANPALLEPLRLAASSDAQRFSQSALAHEMLAFFGRIMNG